MTVLAYFRSVKLRHMESVRRGKSEDKSKKAHALHEVIL